MKKIKTAVVVAIVLSVIGGGTYLYFDGGKVQGENTVTEYVDREVTIEVNPIDEAIKQREIELEEKYSKIKSTEARVDVLKAERDRLDAEIKALQKDLAGFMTATTSKR